MGRYNIVHSSYHKLVFFLTPVKCLPVITDYFHIVSEYGRSMLHIYGIRSKSEQTQETSDKVITVVLLIIITKSEPTH